MNKNLARFVAGPLAAAGLTVGALAFAAAANADDPVQAAPSLFSAHTGPALANAHHVSEPDRAATHVTAQQSDGGELCWWGRTGGAAHMRQAAENHHAR